MRLLTSQCFFLTLITVYVICSIILQYLSPLFFHFSVFISPSLSQFARPDTHSAIQRQCLIRFYYNLHSTVRFHYNTPYRKYLLNCRQRFKTRKEKMRKNLCNLFKNIFQYYFLPYPDTAKTLVSIDSQQLAFIGIFQNVFRI